MDASLIVGIVTAVGIFMTVIVGIVFGCLNQGSSKAFNLPVLTADFDRINAPHSVTGMTRVRFKLESPPSRPDWVVTGASARFPWSRKMLASAVEAGVQSANGQFATYEFDGPWHRRVKFDSPVTYGYVLVHPSESDVRFSFNVCLSSAPNMRSSIPVRYKIS